jgi:hypothetical protein
MLPSAFLSARVVTLSKPAKKVTSMFAMPAHGLFFAGRVKAPPQNASSTQMPFWKTIGMRPRVIGRSKRAYWSVRPE